jgi:hemerythrin-like domain-containing protein
MLRDPSLVPLSHQHQHALALCVRLDRALTSGLLDPGGWHQEVHQLYANEVRFHFAVEEQVLFPAARRFPQLSRLVTELNNEHEELRNYFVRAEQGTLDRAALAAFVNLLSGHIRKEERQLFEALQKQMRPEELKALGEEMAHTLEEAVQVCRLGFKQEHRKSR